MIENSFYRFAQKDSKRTVCNWKRFFKESLGEKTYLKHFDDLFLGSEKIRVSKSVIDFFFKLELENFVKVNRELCEAFFEKEFTKSVLLPEGGFLIKYTKNEKKLFMVSSDHYNNNAPYLNAIYDIDKIQIECTIGVEFVFDDDLKDSWNWHSSLAAGEVAQFLFFLEYYKDYGYGTEDIVKSNETIITRTCLKEWKNIELNHFRDTITNFI